jgi:hypothetical protein
MPTCKTRYKLASGGGCRRSVDFSTGAGNGDPVLDALVPDANLNSVQAIAREEVGTPDNWSIMVQAICAT